MENETLEGLRKDFEEWRSKKQHAGEATPAELLERARTAAREHGTMAVIRATKIDRKHLKSGEACQCGKRVPLNRGGFSRLDLGAPMGASWPPFAEVEMPTGVKLRLFTPTEEAFGLLTSLAGIGGRR